MTITEKLRLAEEIEKRNRARIEAWKKQQKGDKHVNRSKVHAAQSA